MSATINNPKVAIDEDAMNSMFPDNSDAVLPASAQLHNNLFAKANNFENLDVDHIESEKKKAREFKKSFGG